MPVIVFASPKGGSGKTTSATLLAGELAAGGARVTIIDADPNRNISEWASRPGCPEGIEVLSEVREETILDDIDRAAAESPFVVIDLEGTASLMVSYAISLADLVVIPVQGSHLDARQAARAIRLIENQGRATRRAIPYVVVLTRTSPALTPRTLRHVQAELEGAGVPVLDVQLIDREAFRAVFSYGGTVAGLAKHGLGNLESARVNARAFAASIVERLRQGRGAAA
ncbi:MAG: ParA family protein [Geminicoccaceae bacterium]|nr:ParA family protein [Geminicoccaceae bacterium]